MEASRRVQSDSFAALVRQLYRLFKIASIHLMNNQAVTQSLEQSVGVFQRMEEQGLDEISVLFLEDTVFVNGTLLKAGRDVYESAQELARLLKRIGFNQITIRARVSHDDLRAVVEYASLRLRADAEGADEERPAFSENATMRLIDPELLEDLQSGKLTASDRVGRTYASTIVTMRYLFDALKAGRYDVSRQLKRLSQQLVLLADRENPAFLGVTRMRNVHDDEAGRAVNSAILSVAAAKELTQDMRTLSRIAQCALLYDVGRPRAAGMDQATDGLKVIPRLTAEQRAALPASTAVVLTALGRLHDDSVQRTVIGYEALSLQERKQAGLPYNGSHDPRAEAALLHVVRRFNDSLTFDVAKQRRLTPDEAIDRVRRLAASEVENRCFDALLRALGLLPRGTVVRMRSGAIGVVLRNSNRPGLYGLPLIYLFRGADGATLDGPMLDLAHPGREVAVHGGLAEVVTDIAAPESLPEAPPEAEAAPAAAPAPAKPLPERPAAAPIRVDEPAAASADTAPAVAAEDDAPVEGDALTSPSAADEEEFDIVFDDEDDEDVEELGAVDLASIEHGGDDDAEAQQPPPVPASVRPAATPPPVPASDTSDAEIDDVIALGADPDVADAIGEAAKPAASSSFDDELLRLEDALGGSGPNTPTPRPPADPAPSNEAPNAPPAADARVAPEPRAFTPVESIEAVPPLRAATTPEPSPDAPPATIEQGATPGEVDDSGRHDLLDTMDDLEAALDASGSEEPPVIDTEAASAALSEMLASYLGGEARDSAPVPKASSFDHRLDSGPASILDEYLTQDEITTTRDWGTDDPAFEKTPSVENTQDLDEPLAGRLLENYFPGADAAAVDSSERLASPPAPTADPPVVDVREQDTLVDGLPDALDILEMHFGGDQDAAASGESRPAAADAATAEPAAAEAESGGAAEELLRAYLEDAIEPRLDPVPTAEDAPPESSDQEALLRAYLDDNSAAPSTSPRPAASVAHSLRHDRAADREPSGSDTEALLRAYLEATPAKPARPRRARRTPGVGAIEERVSSGAHPATARDPVAPKPRPTPVAAPPRPPTPAPGPLVAEAPDATPAPPVAEPEPPAHEALTPLPMPASLDALDPTPPDDDATPSPDPAPTATPAPPPPVAPQPAASLGELETQEIPADDAHALLRGYTDDAAAPADDFDDVLFAGLNRAYEEAQGDEQPAPAPPTGPFGGPARAVHAGQDDRSYIHEDTEEVPENVARRLLDPFGGEPAPPVLEPVAPSSEATPTAQVSQEQAHRLLDQFRQDDEEEDLAPAEPRPEATPTAQVSQEQAHRLLDQFRQGDEEEDDTPAPPPVAPRESTPAQAEPTRDIAAERAQALLQAYAGDDEEVSQVDDTREVGGDLRDEILRRQRDKDA